jgi:hypothetical protein
MAFIRETNLLPFFNNITNKDKIELLTGADSLLKEKDLLADYIPYITEFASLPY